MPYLSPPTLTTDEQKLILRATSKHPRDHLIISLALGTGLRLGEIVGLDVGDVCSRRTERDSHLGGVSPEVFKAAANRRLKDVHSTGGSPSR